MSRGSTVTISESIRRFVNSPELLKLKVGSVMAKNIVSKILKKLIARLKNNLFRTNSFCNKRKYFF